MSFLSLKLHSSGDDYDNCLLSDEAYSNVNAYSHLDYDLSWNVYILSSDNNCINRNYGSSKWNATKYFKLDLIRNVFQGCYRAIERDYNLDSRLVRDTIRVTSLIKCEEACTDSRLFDCRTFGFSSSLSSSFNCYLSDRSSIDLDTGLDLVRDFDSAVYEKIPCSYDSGYRTGKITTLKLYSKIELLSRQLFSPAKSRL